MNDNSQLREQMWELCYDLLPADERSALIARVKSDPQAARLYAEVRLQADLVGYAAKVEDSSLILSVDGKKDAPADELAPAGGRRKEASEAPAPRAARSGFGLNLLALAAGLALVLLLGFGAFWRPASSYNVAQGLVVTEIETPARMPAGVTHKFTVRTMSAKRESLSAEVLLSIKDSGGMERYHRVVPTDEAGMATVDVPGSALVPGARMEADTRVKRQVALADNVERVNEDSVKAAEATNYLAANLPVEASQPMTYFLFARPVAQAGETMEFAAVSVDPFLFERASPEISDLVVVSSAGAPVTHPTWTTDNKVLVGEIVVSPTTSASELTLSARDSEGKKQQASFQLGPARKLADGRQLARPMDQVGQRYERGDKPSPPGGVDRPEKDFAQFGFPANQQQDKGRAELLLSLQRLKDTSGEQADVAAGQPVTFEVPALQAGQRVVVTAMCRGVVVARQNVESDRLDVLAQSDRSSGPASGKELARQKVTLDLPPEADGEIRLAVVDQGQTPPIVLGEQLVYRRPTRELKIELAEGKDQYAPDEQVKLRLKVLDENGEPARVGVVGRVWNEEYLAAASEQPVLLADAVRRSNRGLAANNGLAANRGLAESESGERLARNRSVAAKANLLAVDGSRDDAAMGKRSSGATAPPAGAAPPSPPTGAGAPPSPAEAAPAATPATAFAPAPAPVAAPVKASEGLTLKPADRAPAQARPVEDGLVGGLAADQPTADTYFAEASLAAAIPEQPTRLLASNESLIVSKYNALARESDEAWQARQALLGRILIGGGLAALAVLGALFLLRTPVRAASGSLVLVAAAASLVVGAVWIGQQQPTIQIAGISGGADRRSELESLHAPAKPRGMAMAGGARESEAAADSTFSDAPLAPATTPALPDSLPPLSKATKGQGDETGAVTEALPPRGPTPAAPAGPLAKESVVLEQSLESAKKPQATAADKSETNLARPAAAGLRSGGGEEKVAKSLETKLTENKPAENKPAEGSKVADKTDRDAALGLGGAGGFGAGSPGGTAGKGGATRGGLGAAGPIAAGQGGGGLGGLGGRGAAGGGFGEVESAQGTTYREQARSGSSPASGTGRPADQPRFAKTDPAAIPAGDPTKESRELRDSTRAKDAGAPPSLFFDPRLATDEQGFVTIEFQMPPVEAKYRVLVDAFGQGRIGSASLPIECRATPSK